MLTTKAEKMGEQLTLAKTAIDVSLSLSPDGIHRTNFKSPLDSEWPSYTDVASIYDARLKVCERNQELTDRLRKWGIID